MTDDGACRALSPKLTPTLSHVHAHSNAPDMTFRSGRNHAGKHDAGLHNFEGVMLNSTRKCDWHHKIASSGGPGKKDREFQAASSALHESLYLGGPDVLGSM